MKKQLFIILTFICIQSGYLFSMQKQSTPQRSNLERLILETAQKTGMTPDQVRAIIAVRSLDFESVNISTTTPNPDYQ